MALNIKGALAAGYSPKDIVDLLAEEGRYNIASARQSGFSDDDILSTLQEGPTAGPLEALKGATKRLISSTRTGLAAPFDAEEAALAGLERQEAITERPAALSLEELKKLAETEGYFPAAKEAISSIPSAIASQIPYIAEMGAGALAGGAAAGPVGAVLGGIGLPAVTYLGSNVERQAAEQASQEAPIDINTGKAAAAAVGQAALDRFGLTLGGLGRVVGKAPLGTEAAERIAKESVLKATTKGAGRLAAAEIPTEVTQQMIERAQAGLPLTTQDALDEYKEVLYQTTLMSPLGSMARLQERSGAKFDVEQRDAQIAAEQARMRNMELSRIEQERLREEGIASEAIAAQKALAAEDAAKTANLLKMQQGDLGFGTTVEEVAARRGFAEPQQDLFFTPEEAARAAEYRPQAVEAPAVSSLKELPSGRQILTPETIKSFGFKPKSKVAQELRDLDFSDPNTETKFDDILDKYTKLVKADGAAAIEIFKGELNDLRRARTTETAGESPDLFRAPDVPEPVAGAGSPVGYRVDGDRTDIAGPEVRAKAEPTPLTPEKRLRDLQEGETITSGGNVYRKTATGFEMVKPTEPAAQEVIKEEPQKVVPEAPKQPQSIATKPTISEAEREGLQAAKEFDEAGWTDEDLSQRMEQGEGTTKENIQQALNDWYLSPTQTAQVADIVPTAADLPADVLGTVKREAAKRGIAKGAIQAFTHKGKAYLIADRIQPGTERSVFMHEVGAHLGLTTGEVKTIANKVNKWSAAEQGSVERDVYDAVQKRMAAAKETSDEELVAYTIEEAANRGITPTAVLKAKAAPPNTVAGIIRWIAEKFMQSAKSMFNAITSTPTPQDLIDYVYGSTRKVLREGPVKTRQTSDLSVLKKPGFYEEPVTNTRLDTLYRQAGGKPIGQEVKPGVFNSIADDPAKYVAERRKEGSRFLDSIATNWFSSDAALQKAIRRGLASLGKDWDSVRNMLYQASTSQALHGEAVAHQFLEQGGIQYDPNTYKYVVSKGPASWKDLFDTVKVAAKNHNVNFAQMAAYAHQYMVARRLKGLSERNDMYEERAQQLEKQRDRNGAQAARDKIKVIHLTDEQIDAGMKLGQAIPELTQLAEQWNLVRKSVLDFAVDSGLYSREDADALADVMDYVPFYRVEQLEASAGPREFTRGLLDSAMDKAFKGSTQEVNDVFDNMERWTSYIIRKGINNRTAQNLVDVAFEAMPEDVQAVAKTARGMRENTISIWRDGELQKYEFSDPLYVKAFTGIESAAIPALKGWAKFADILRQNVVLNPLFSLSQLPQDAFGAMFSSGVEHPFSLPLQVMSEFYKTLAGTSSAHEALKSVGVVGTRDYSAQVSRIDAEISAGLKSPKALDKLLDPLRKLSMASDNAVRQAIYNQTMKETGDKAKAVERAFEVINFRRAGASREATILRQTIPFFGAYLQAMNVAAKVIGGEGIAPAQKAEARKILLSTMGKTFVLGLIYSAMIEDDEDYKKIDPTIRDHHLVIPGSGGLMIPIRPDVFTLFAKILPEHMYNLAYGAEDATKAKKALKEGLANAILGPTPMPQAVRPIFEVAANHDFYTGRPVVGKGMENLAAEQQYSANTSELAKTIGSVTGTSPMNWDHLLKAYFGYTGGLALMATNSLIAAGAGRPLPDKSPQDFIASIPGMSTFVSKEFGGRDLSDYYELRDKVDEAVKTLNHHKTYSTREEAKAFLQENKQLLSVKTQVNRINQNLSKIRQQERLIIESAMDPAEKQVKLRALNVRKHNMLKNIEALRLRAGL